MAACSHTLFALLLLSMSCHGGRAPDRSVVANGSTTLAPPATSSRPAAEEHVSVVATVVRLLAVGWADAPAIALESRPDATATLYVPAGAPHADAAPSCWGALTATPPAVGDRYRLTLTSLPTPASGGGPYVLHVRIVEHGVATNWAVRECPRLPSSH